MSLAKSTTRRVTLLTSSSLAAAGIAAAASLGAAALPTAAAAQVTCVVPPAPASGNGTNAVVYGAGTQNPAITCVYVGDNGVVSTTGNITVSSAAPGGGVNLSATGDDSLTWDSTAGTVTGSTQTNGPVIDATTATGDITINTAAVTGTANTVTHGIRAVSASGDIAVAAGGTVSATNATSGVTAIHAQTGGDGDVTVGVATLGNNINASGRLHGIYAQVDSGDLAINLSGIGTGSGLGAVQAAVDSAASAGIYAIGGAGSTLTINVSGMDVLGTSSGAAIRTDAGGDAVINISGSAANVRGPVIGRTLNQVSSVTGLDMSIAAGTTTTLNMGAYSGSTALARNDADSQLRRIRGAGAGDFVGNIDGHIHQSIDLSDLTGSVTLNFLDSGAWFIQGEYVHLGDGDSTLTTALGGVELGYEEINSATGQMLSIGGRLFVGTPSTSNAVNGPFEAVHVLDFGAGEDVFDHAGYMIVGGLPFGQLNTDQIYKHMETEVRFDGLETFVNRGVILMGGRSGYLADASFMGAADYTSLSKTDAWHDDILSMPGTTLVGSRVVDGDGQTMRRWNGEWAVGEIIMDVDTLGVQTNCERDPTTGDLAAADCLILDGGTIDATDNPLYIRIAELVPGDRGTLNTGGIVLVDMGATGVSQQGDVAISPNQDGFNPLFGGFMDKGAFAYVIAFDEDTNQHKLFSGASANTAQMPLIAQSAHALWRLSTGTWLDRQADLRNEDLDDNMGGFWARIAGEKADRDATHTLTFVGQDFVFDNTYEQKSYALTTGLDLLFGADANTTYVAGLMLGYAHADLEWQASPNSGRIESWTLGGYGSVVHGGMFVDAAINAHNSLLRYDAPAMDLFPDDTILDTDMLSVGGQIEAGWRFPFGAAFVEPLAGLSYVRTRFEDLEIPADDPTREGVTVEFDDPTSLRAGVGARAGIDQDFGVVRAQFSGLVRFWNEFEDETRASLINPGSTGVVSDDFTGQFTELGLGASVFSPGGLVSGFVNIGGKFGDDYEAQTASAGVRVNW